MVESNMGELTGLNTGGLTGTAFITKNLQKWFSINEGIKRALAIIVSW